MDFFGAQEQAKQRTAWAIFLFILGTLAVAMAVYFVYMDGFVRYRAFLPHDESIPNVVDMATPLWEFPVRYFNLREFVICEIATIGIILAASLYKISCFGFGGITVAQAVGARFIDPTIDGEKERQLQNVVEEMAIASGYGVPQVGVLDDEPGINAFAAAIDHKDAVVVVTRGALDNLSRDELQAVVGHEFSHLLNGDCKMNITLAGWIYGLFFIFIIGRMLVNGARVSDDRRKGGGILIGFSLMLIGLIGWLFGRIIQALISRQREFLADASSVQFTRNPGAMVTALGKIRQGSQIEHHNASGLAHFFFANSSPFGDFFYLFATHPPLEERMKAIDENYQQTLGSDEALRPSSRLRGTGSGSSTDEFALQGGAGGDPAFAQNNAGEQNDIESQRTGEPAGQTGAQPPFTNSPAPRAGAGGWESDAAKAVTLATLISAIGDTPTADAIDNLRETTDNFPPSIKTALSSPAGAQAILLGLALPAGNTEDRENCVGPLQEKLSPEVFRSLYDAEAALGAVDIKHRLVLAQMAAARAKTISPEEKIKLGLALEAIVAFDGVLSTFEAFYIELVRGWLDLPADYPAISKEAAASRLLCFLYAAQNDQAPISLRELSKVLDGLTLPVGKIRALKYVSTVSLREALPSLLQFNFLQRRELLIAVGRVLKLDNVLTDEEVEIFRTIAGIMQCPVPPRI